MAFDFPVILLAAGGSTRMAGRDKLMEQVDGIPLLERQAARARAATTGPVLVALPPRPHPRYDAVAGLGVTCLSVAEAAEGMNASLRTAVAALPPGAACAMVLLADLPDIDTADLITVGAAVDPTTSVRVWRGATQDGRPGHPIVFHADLFPAFAGLSGDGGGKEVVALAGEHVRLVPLPDDRARRDLDTPADWAAWRETRAK